MTDPRVTELDYDAIKERVFVALTGSRACDWWDDYARDVPALLDRIEVLEGENDELRAEMVRVLEAVHMNASDVETRQYAAGKIAQLGDLV
jgi:hypothetical protein